MTDEPWLYEAEWSIDSEYGQEKRISSEIATLGIELGCFAGRIDDMRTAVTEAVLNAMEHGNGMSGSRKVRVTLRLYGDKAIFRIADEGGGFDVEQWERRRAEAVRLESKLQQDDPRGWGLFLISSLSDRLRFGREGGSFYTEIEFANE